MKKRILPSAALSLLVALAGIVVSGCVQQSVRIHDRFGELRPSTVGITVENRTLRADLDHYATAGFLQRTLLGPGDVNIPAVMENEARRSLESLGYSTLSASVDPQEVEGELRVRILRWREIPPFSGGGVEGEFELELVRTDTKEKEPLFFHGRCFCRAGGRRSSRAGVTASELERAVRSAVARCLSALPPGPHLEEGSSPAAR